jgi:hypothetical protein
VALLPHAMAVEGAVPCVTLFTATPLDDPAHVMVDWPLKFSPKMLKVRLTPAVSPAVSAANRMGIGLLMVTMLADDALPPGAGFSTVTL